MTAKFAGCNRAIATRFAVGSVIGAATWSGAMLAQVTGPAALLLPAFGVFVGGAVAGTAFRRSISTAFAFGLAFAIGDAAGMVLLVATQAAPPVLLAYVLSYSIVFGIAGLIGLSSAAVSGRPLLFGVLSFSFGGCATAILLVVLLNMNVIGGSPLRAAVGFAIAMTFPWVIGGILVSSRRRE